MTLLLAGKSIKASEAPTMTFAICLEGYEASLALRKIYEVLVPEDKDPKGYIRIVDESGEDYLYSAKPLI
jgi:hypothetical protein